MQNDPQTHSSQPLFDRADPPDLGVIKASSAHQLFAFGMALIFSVFLLCALLNRDQTSSVDLWAMCGLIPPLIVVLINGALLKLYIEKGAITKRGLFTTGHVLYEDILSVGKRMVKQKYGEREAIIFLTVHNKQLGVLQGQITERDYERLYQWATKYFPET